LKKFECVAHLDRQINSLSKLPSWRFRDDVCLHNFTIRNYRKISSRIYKSEKQMESILLTYVLN